MSGPSSSTEDEYFAHQIEQYLEKANAIGKTSLPTRSGPSASK